MPELPEVETVVRSLNPVLSGLTMERVTIYWERTITGDVENFIETLQRRTVNHLFRKGKYICFSLDDGSYLTVHLRMTGKLVYQPKGNEESHIRVKFSFKEGPLLYFIDMRKFGRLKHWPPQTPLLPHLGPDPLESRQVLRTLEDLNSSRRIKTILLDQKILAGIGNIYADEALFASGINPATPLPKIPGKKLKKLSRAIPQILASAIANKGTTLSDYRPPESSAGNNQHYLKIYGRESLECYKCGTIISRIKINNRSSHFCPRCQT